jgi:hypothetical protein
MKGMQTAGKQEQGRVMVFPTCSPESGGRAGRHRHSLANAVATPETGRTGLLEIARIVHTGRLVYTRGRARLAQRAIGAARALSTRRDADEPVPEAGGKRGSAAVLADAAECRAVGTGMACHVAVKTEAALLIPPASLASRAERAAHAWNARGSIAALTREPLRALVTVGRDA